MHAATNNAGASNGNERANEALFMSASLSTTSLTCRSSLEAPLDQVVISVTRDSICGSSRLSLAPKLAGAIYFARVFAPALPSAGDDDARCTIPFLAHAA